MLSSRRVGAKFLGRGLILMICVQTTSQHVHLFQPRNSYLGKKTGKRRRNCAATKERIHTRATTYSAGPPNMTTGLQKKKDCWSFFYFSFFETGLFLVGNFCLQFADSLSLFYFLFLFISLLSCCFLLLLSLGAEKMWPQRSVKN